MHSKKEEQYVRDVTEKTLALHGSDKTRYVCFNTTMGKQFSMPISLFISTLNSRTGNNLLE